jgi:hypothetical protein
MPGSFPPFNQSKLLSKAISYVRSIDWNGCEPLKRERNWTPLESAEKPLAG